MVKVKAKVWFEKDGKIAFGKGRALLLQKIDELGSLNKAAEELHMSYRAAWGKLKATEQLLGKKLVDSSPQGASLNTEGRKWLNKYKETVAKVKKVL